MKKIALLGFAVLLLSYSAPALAQAGCVNSPENPTAVLALLGSAGGLLVAARSRFGGK